MASKEDYYNIAYDCVDKNGASLLNKNKIALIVVRDGDPKPTRLTFSRLMGLTSRMANGLKSLGIAKGDRVLLQLPNGPEFPLSFLGAIKLGALPIPTSPLFTWSELKYLLEDSDANTLITTAEILPQGAWEERPARLKNIILVAEQNSNLPPGTRRWQEILKQADSQFAILPTTPNDPAFWLYTSGTTGQPKAAIHAHRSIRAHDRRCQLWLDVQESDVLFNTSSLNWSYALTAGMLDIWRHGLTSVIYQGELSPEKICQVIGRFGVSTFMSVPGIYRRLIPYLREHPDAFAGVRVCLSAGENLSLDIREAFKEATEKNIHEGLGMTENSVYLVQPSHEEPIPGSLGQPVFPDQIQILREDLTPAPTHEIGILSTRADCEGLMLGYHQRNGELERPFQNNWFLSGDFAHVDNSGNFYFNGRRDDVITAGGYRISPLEVEKVLNQIPEVEESAVVAAQVDEKNIVQAHVVLSPEFQPDPSLEEKILKLAKETLASYKVPRKILFESRLPKTLTGKLKRKALTS